MVRERVSLNEEVSAAVEVVWAVVAGAVALDICFTSVSNSVLVEGLLSISRMSCSIPCCSCRAKSSSVRSNSGAELDCWDVEAKEGGGGFVVVDLEVGGTVEEEPVAPESKSSRMSSSQYLNACDVLSEGMERDHLDRLGHRVLVALPCFDVWRRTVALNFVWPEV